MKYVRAAILVLVFSAVADGRGGGRGGGHSLGGSGTHTGSHSGAYGSHSAGSGHSSSSAGYRSSSHYHGGTSWHESTHFHVGHTSRYASGVVRDSRGRILRSEAARREFMDQTGYPHGRQGYVIDHVVPLKEGGADSPSNMQWQTKEEAKAKDRWE